MKLLPIPKKNLENTTMKNKIKIKISHSLNDSTRQISEQFLSLVPIVE